MMYGYGGGGGVGADGTAGAAPRTVTSLVNFFPKVSLNAGNGGFGGGGAGGNLYDVNTSLQYMPAWNGGSGGGGGYNGGGGGAGGSTIGGGGSSYADGGLWNINSYGDQGNNAYNGSFRLLYGINQTANDLMVVGGQTTNFTSGTNSFTTIFVGGLSTNSAASGNGLVISGGATALCSRRHCVPDYCIRDVSSRSLLLSTRAESVCAPTLGTKGCHSWICIASAYPLRNVP